MLITVVLSHPNPASRQQQRLSSVLFLFGIRAAGGGAEPPWRPAGLEPATATFEGPVEVDGVLPGPLRHRRHGQVRHPARACRGGGLVLCSPTGAGAISAAAVVSGDRPPRAGVRGILKGRSQMPGGELRVGGHL